ncbi:hypothetical protein PVK06_048639 [Gossypium arboreum]|uniref:Uncharacterized protein n=1 Tax=Gossypium arboreum TaxID=29729 RepID=A0ABR0MJ67_GOSAR|nr:hypothetical protein PVK06_048639 [Gossypium arboreum]
MSAFPTFPKELLSDPKDEDKDEVEATVTSTSTHPATVEKVTKEKEGEEEKIESVNIDSVKKGDNMNPTFAPQEPITHCTPIGARMCRHDEENEKNEEENERSEILPWQKVEWIANTNAMTILGKC